VAESTGPREVVVTARQMSFYLDGETAANPVIRVRPGERVRITLVNNDAGVDHDFAVPAWKVSTRTIQGAGTTSVLFQAPDKPGTTAYVCSLHARMMTGTIEVSASRRPANPTR
jgi:plastocyanin